MAWRPRALRRPGDARPTHRARVESARVLGCCTLLTTSILHKAAQGRRLTERGEAAVAGGRSQRQQQSQNDSSHLALRDDAAAPTPRALAERSPRNSSTRQDLARRRELGSMWQTSRLRLVQADAEQSTARSRASNSCSPRTQLASCSLPPRPAVARPARLFLPCERPCIISPLVCPCAVCPSQARARCMHAPFLLPRSSLPLPPSLPPSLAVCAHRLAAERQGGRGGTTPTRRD